MNKRSDTPTIREEHVDDTEREELAIRLEEIPSALGIEATHGDGLHEADDRDRDCARKKALGERELKHWELEAGQSARDRSHNTHFSEGSLDQEGHQAPEEDHDESSRSSREMAHLREQDEARAQSEEERREVDGREVWVELPHNSKERCVSHGREAEQVWELGESDQQRGCGGETAEHRLREQRDDVTEPERTHRELEQPHHEAEEGRGARVLLLGELSDASERGEDEQRVDRRGAHGELPRRTNEHVAEGRHERRVEARDGGEPGHERIGHRLGNEENRGRQPRQKVTSDNLSSESL